MVTTSVPHGTISGYQWHKCRCEACRGANREYMRSWKASHPEFASRNREYQREWTQKRKDIDPDYEREKWCRRAYGISLAEYDEYMSKPCAICGGESEHLDHNHSTGAIRAGLCSKCNVSIGLMGEDASRLREAANYIERFGD